MGKGCCHKPYFVPNWGAEGMDESILSDFDGFYIGNGGTLVDPTEGLQGAFVLPGDGKLKGLTVSMGSGYASRPTGSPGSATFTLQVYRGTTLKNVASVTIAAGQLVVSAKAFCYSVEKGDILYILYNSTSSAVFATGSNIAVSAKLE